MRNLMLLFILVLKGYAFDGQIKTTSYYNLDKKLINVELPRFNLKEVIGVGCNTYDEKVSSGTIFFDPNKKRVSTIAGNKYDTRSQVYATWNKGYCEVDESIVIDFYIISIVTRQRRYKIRTTWEGDRMIARECYQIEPGVYKCDDFELETTEFY